MKQPDHSSNVTPMLSARARATPSPVQPQGSPPDHQEDPDVQSSTDDLTPPVADESLISHGRVPRPKEATEKSRPSRLVTLLTGTALTVGVLGALAGAAVWTAHHFGVAIPFVNDQPHRHTGRNPTHPAQIAVAQDQPSSPPAELLAPPTNAFTRQPDRNQVKPETDDNAFAGEGIATQTKPQPQPVAQAPAPAPIAQATAPSAAFPVPPVAQAPTQALQAPNPPPVALQASSSAAAPAVAPSVPATPPAPPQAATTESSPDVKLEMALATKLHDLDEHVTSMEKRIADIQQAMSDRISTGMGTLSGRMDELQHREDQLQSGMQSLKTALPAPVNAASAKNGEHTTHSPIAKAPAAAPSTPPAPKPAPSAPERPRPVYHVQAGAPDIAILQDNSGNAVRVVKGDTLPGWGEVSSISQAGSGWVVKTEHGSIR